MNVAPIFKQSIIFAFIFSACAALSFGQENPQTVFDRANEELEAGDYNQAISLYKQLERQNTVSGALFLNLGLSYQRIDSLGKAKYYLLKASRIDETSERAEKALEYVESQFSRQSAVLPQLPWDRATNWLQHQIGASTLLGIGIILLNLGILIYIAGWFVNKFANYFNTGGLLIIGLSVIVIATSFYTHYVAERYSTAVMVAEKNPVREQPVDESSLISQAYEGYAFTVDHYRSASHSNWSYVRMSNGLYGWIPNNNIKVL